MALCQLNTTVGDLAGNAERLIEAIGAAHSAGADLAITPELGISGYPPEDLLSKRHFLDLCAARLDEVAAATGEIVALVGWPERDGGSVFNSLAVVSRGTVHGSYRKALLPNYGVFDERRYFESGAEPALIELGDVRIGLTICEDVWFPGPPAATEAMAGAGLIVNASASPFHRAKGSEREHLVRSRALENDVAFALCNAVGGQDELVFDGHSLVVSHEGELLGRARQFEEDLLICDLPVLAQPHSGDTGSVPAPARVRTIASFPLSGAVSPAEPRIEDLIDPLEETYRALELGLGDYVRKNRFEHVVLGLSGGIDSALVAVIAADALGPEAVSCVVMPSPHSSRETQADARELAGRLGCELIEIPIEPAMRAFDSLLGDRLDPEGVAVENIQARIRGIVVMALSNEHGWLALTTGNKSEMAVGYATLYGDMAGGFAVIKDVPKTLVYELSRHRNRADDAPIGDAIIEREPSAELRPGQRDSDSLPPYERLDPILERYVEMDHSPERIAEELGDSSMVERVVALVDRAEYKRRQAPPGVKITPRAFGRDRRLPITNRFGA